MILSKEQLRRTCSKKHLLVTSRASVSMITHVFVSLVFNLNLYSITFYNHGQKSWDSGTVRTRNWIRALLTLYVPTPYPQPTDNVETVKAQFL